MQKEKTIAEVIEEGHFAVSHVDLPTEYTKYDPIEEKPYDKYYWIKKKAYQIHTYEKRGKYALIEAYSFIYGGYFATISLRLDLVDLEKDKAIPILGAITQRIGYDILEAKEKIIDYHMEEDEEKIKITYKKYFPDTKRPSQILKELKEGKELETIIYKQLIEES